MYKRQEEGQIYVPFTNWTLYLAVVALVIGFQNSSNLAAAYGIAVTGTMLIDTILVAFVMVLMWRWHWLAVALVAGSLLAVDIAFFAANAIKIPEGGWFPIAMALVSFTTLTTWRLGRRLVSVEIAKQSVPMFEFLKGIDDVHRVRGTAVFMTSSKEGVPAALLHNLRHNQVLHERVVLVTVQDVYKRQPVDQACSMTPSLICASMRKWPSMRVIGSITRRSLMRPPPGRPKEAASQ